MLTLGKLLIRKSYIRPISEREKGLPHSLQNFLVSGFSLRKSKNINPFL